MADISHVGTSVVDIPWRSREATLPPPSGIQPGDLLILAGYWTNGTRALLPQGPWWPIMRVYSGPVPVTLAAYWRVVSDFYEPPEYHLTFSRGLFGGTAAILAYRNVGYRYGSPILHASGQGNIFNRPIATPASDAELPAGTMLVALFAEDNFGEPTFDPPRGMTERFDEFNDDCAGCGADEFLKKKTKPGQRTAVSHGGGTPSAGILLALNGLS